jgi:hypothetical protein
MIYEKEGELQIVNHNCICVSAFLESHYQTVQKCTNKDNFRGVILMGVI